MNCQCPLNVILFAPIEYNVISLDFDLNFCSRGDKIDLSVINPRREKSGLYKVILKNNQGKDERDIMVNIMGKQSIRKIEIYNLIK